MTPSQTLLSSIVSGILAFASPKLPFWARFGLSPLMLIIVLISRSYIKSYWTPEGKEKGTKVPLPNMDDYNVAVKKTEDLLQVLEYLEYSWVFTSLLSSIVKVPEA